jgi:Domain of unknown function (DUF1929)
MQRYSRRSSTAPRLIAATLALLFACTDSLTEPEFARVNARYQLTVTGTGSQAGGQVTSDRGGVSCTVSAGGSTSGKCAQSFKSGSIVTLHLAPAAGAVVANAPSNCPFTNETNNLACEVVMSRSLTVVVNFNPQSNTVTLSVSGGASGSGGVTSTPSGISCTITNGTAGTGGCSAPYALNTSVTLTATAATGSYLKAWAGGGCDAAGTGVGKSTGACTVSMTQVTSILVSFDRPANAALAGQWGNPFTWPAMSIHANLLPDGRVFTWGRTDHLPVTWDPVSSSFGSVSRPGDLFCSGHALLPDGRLLVSGGHSGTDNQGTLSTEIFDYRTNSWVAGLPDMRNGRWYPTVLALTNGEMLTISGGDTAKALNRIPEVWTSGNTWRALTGAAADIPYYPMLFSAPDGRVFVAGPNRGTGYLNTAGTGGWTAGPSSAYGGRDYGSAVMYEPGKILLVGGGGPTNTAEKIDLNAGAAAVWQPAGQMRVPRRQMNATLLADGTVLVTGGSNASGFNTKPTSDDVLAAERWSSTGGWSQLARQTHYRLYHSNALLLPDARVLSVGSGQPAASGLSDDFTAELYSPPYLFTLDGTAATRPAITSAPASVAYGQTFSVGTPNAADIAKVTWIRLSTVTHSTNMSQRLNYLSFTAGGTTLSVTAPTSRNLAPPGHYMLFLVNQEGVPSVAKIVQIF